MVTNTLTWRAVFRSFSPPSVVTDVLTDLMIGAGVDMLSDIEIIVMATPAITLELMVGVAYAGGVLTNLLLLLLLLLLYVLIIDSVTAIDVDMLADENENGLAAVMIPLEFTLSAP